MTANLITFLSLSSLWSARVRNEGTPVLRPRSPTDSLQCPLWVRFNLQPPSFSLHVSALRDIWNSSIETEPERALAATGRSSTFQTKGKWRKRQTNRNNEEGNNSSSSSNLTEFYTVGNVWTLTSHHLDAQTFYFLSQSVQPEGASMKIVLVEVSEPPAQGTYLHLRYVIGASRRCATHSYPLIRFPPLHSLTSAQAGPSTVFLYLCTSHSDAAPSKIQKGWAAAAPTKSEGSTSVLRPFFLSTYQSFFLLSLNPKFRLRAFSTSTCVYSSNKLVAGITHDTGSQLHLPPPHTNSSPAACRTTKNNVVASSHYCRPSILSDFYRNGLECIVGQTSATQVSFLALLPNSEPLVLRSLSSQRAFRWRSKSETKSRQKNHYSRSRCRMVFSVLATSR